MSFSSTTCSPATVSRRRFLWPPSWRSPIISPQDPGARASLRELGVHERSLHRLLRALASVGIFAEDADGYFGLTPLAELLRSDLPDSQRATVQMMVGQFYEAWGGLLESIRTGEPAFLTRKGKSFFDDLAENHDRARIFDAAMKSRNDRKTQAMLAVYDFTGVRLLADIGGGNGSLLTAVLKTYPAMRAILFDRAGVIERARGVIASEGLTERVKLESGSFLESVPRGADAYLLRHILHNWDDEDAVVILERVHEAMEEKGTLLVIDRVIPPGNEPMFGKIMDLNMLVMLGGVERTLAEFQRLFGQAGFVIQRIVPTEAEVSVIEAKRN